MIKTWLILGGFTLLACVLSLILTPIARTIMKRIGAVDLPAPRRVNRVPVPRGGGIAVILSFYISLTLAWFTVPDFISSTFPLSLLPWFIAASAILTFIGLLDDIRGITPITKLLAQLLVAGLLCYGGARLIFPPALGTWVASPWVYTPLTIVWYIAVINAFNLIDGLDGLSSGLGIIATVGMIGVFFFENITVTPILCLIFIGSLLGFLRYNYHPASIFLGDTGSLFVGLTLATITLVTRRSDAFLVTMGIPILCMGVPLLDTSLAILRRTLRRMLQRRAGATSTGGAMTADKDHMHHRLLALTKGNQRRAVWGLYALTLTLVALGFTTAAMRESKVAVFLVGFIAIATIFVRFMVNVEFWDAGRLLTNPGSRIGRRTFTVPLYILADLFSMALTFLVVYSLMQSRLPPINAITWTTTLLVYGVPVLIGLAFTHAHVRIWGRCSRKDFLSILFAIGVTSAIAHIILTFVAVSHFRTFQIFHILWAALLPVPILVSRLIKSSFIQWMAGRENLRLLKASETDDTIERVLFYGAGINLESYLRIFEINITRNQTALVGILDDNLGLKGRFFRDLKIFGGLEILNDPQMVRRLRPTHIIITTPSVGEERTDEIRAFCRANKITLTRLALTEQSL